MDVGTSALFLVVSVLATNQLVMRARVLYVHDAVFWSLEGLNIACGLFILVRGLPGFHHAPAVGFVVGLLFVLHAAQNLQMRARVLSELAQEEVVARQARAAELRAHLTDDPGDEED